MLAALVAWALDVPGRGGTWIAVASLVLCLAYGASDELHQVLVHGRGPSPVDVLIDGFGALVGLAAYAVGRRHFSRRHPGSVPDHPV